MDYHPSSTIFIDNILAQRQGLSKWILKVVYDILEEYKNLKRSKSPPCLNA